MANKVKSLPAVRRGKKSKVKILTLYPLSLGRGVTAKQAG